MKTLLDYYTTFDFNPLDIAVEEKHAWEKHVKKRVNLYQRHLHIPLAFLRDKEVLEIGCATGENSLVLALFGAKLTLVEPNEKFHSRIFSLFKEFKLEKQLREVSPSTMEEIQIEKKFVLVLAENFLHTLKKRDSALQKLCQCIERGGVGCISYLDQCGSLLEFLKRAVYWRVAGERSEDRERGLRVARELFEEDYSSIPVSRRFEVWWADNLANPFFDGTTTWTIGEILSLLSEESCEFYSSSPLMFVQDHFTWYKDLTHLRDRNKRIVREYISRIPYLVAGIPSLLGENPKGNREMCEEVRVLVKCLSEIGKRRYREKFSFPKLKEFQAYTEEWGNKDFSKFFSELKLVLATLEEGNPREVRQRYQKCRFLRQLWGCPNIYLSFFKQGVC